MSPAVLRLPGTTIAGVPIPPADNRLTSGSLLLVDPTHPTDPYSGPVTHGEQIPNIAKTQATALGIAADTVEIFNTATSTARAKIERTASGSLHFTSSATQSVLEERVGLAIPAGLRTYLAANKTHRFFLGLQIKVTRPDDGGATVGYMAGVFSGTNWGVGAQIALGTLANGTLAGYPASSDATRLGFTATSGTNANQLGAISSNGLNNNLVETSSYVVSSGPYNAASVNNSPSFILRSIYLEDLTVSGRSHAAVAELEQAAFQAGASGRWSADTATALA
ncbi:hypothetical protein [Zhihengliuella sp.]|uniref:hypothetical protein n=1 Tax=Zhihengliuella sp. TaxID=1954483 RepID=UPI002811EC47|nr:hypothetical protein [Zhihengliuella sp.]